MCVQADEALHSYHLENTPAHEQIQRAFNQIIIGTLDYLALDAKCEPSRSNSPHETPLPDLVDPYPKDIIPDLPHNTVPQNQEEPLPRKGIRL